jgi:hypothetical protein
LVGLLRSRRWWWLLPGAAGVGLTLLIMTVLPPDRHIDHLGEFVFKLSPLLLAVPTVAGFPRRPGLGMALLGVLVVGYMGVIDTLDVLHIFDFAEAPDRAAAFPRLYQFTIFLNAFTVIAILFGYRLGGATTDRVLKVGVAAVLLVISGLNDLSFYYLYAWPEGRPARLDWASHIEVFVGGPPTPAVAIGFCLVHVALAGLVLALPVQRWLDRLVTPRRQTVTAPGR